MTKPSRKQIAQTAIVLHFLLISIWFFLYTATSNQYPSIDIADRAVTLIVSFWTTLNLLPIVVFLWFTHRFDLDKQNFSWKKTATICFIVLFPAISNTAIFFGFPEIFPAIIFLGPLTIFCIIEALTVLWPKKTQDNNDLVIENV